MIEQEPDLTPSYYPQLKALEQAGNWAKIMAVSLFVIGGILAIFAFTGANLLSGFYGMEEMGMQMPNMGLFFIIFYIPIAILYIFIGYKLWMFATLASNGVKNNNPEEWMDSFLPLKTYFLVTGILILIGLGIMFLSLVLTVVVGGSMVN